jgi:TonB family protein
MWKWLTAVLAFLALGATGAAQTPPPEDQPAFQPPSTISVTDIPVYPDASVGIGTVVLDVMIDEKGTAQDVEVRRDVPALTAEAVRAVKEWKFAPARWARKAVVSRMTVAINFRPALWAAQPMALPLLIPQTDQVRIQQAFQPAEITWAAFPEYSVTAFVPGTVILEVTVSDTGEPADAKVVRDWPPFAPLALDAVKNWRFMPAAWNGKAIASKVVLVFVFRTPPTYDPTR